jgi:hypothetical protein
VAIPGKRWLFGKTCFCPLRGTSGGGPTNIPLKSASKDLQFLIDKLQVHKHKGYDIPKSFDMST